MTSTETPTTAATTIAELYGLMREADGALASRYHTASGLLIRDISQIDGSSFWVWTNLNEQVISGAAMVILAAPVPNVTCPLGCGREISAEADDIHYCVTKIRIGRKVETHREYVGTWDGRAMFYGACYDEVKRQLRPYREEMFASGLTRTVGELDGGDPEAVALIDPATEELRRDLVPLSTATLALRYENRTGFPQSSTMQRADLIAAEINALQPTAARPRSAEQQLEAWRVSYELHHRNDWHRVDVSGRLRRQEARRWMGAGGAEPADMGSSPAR